MSSDDVFERAGTNLRRAASAASLIETFALTGLVLGLLGTASLVASVLADESADSGAAIGGALALALAAGTTYAVLRGLASIITLMVDRVLIEAEDDGE